MTDKNIKEALEKLGLPAFQDEVPEDELKDFNYLYFTNGAIRKSNCFYYQDVEIIWVSEKYSNTDYFEISIIEAIEKLGLKMNGDGVYDIARKSKTNELINTLTLTFTRVIKRL